MRDMLVIGGGPAGLAAAAYGLHLRLNVAMVAPEIGGKTAYTFNIRGLNDVSMVHGVELVQTFAAQVENADNTHDPRLVETLRLARRGFTAGLSDGSEILARSVVIATGARPRRLYVPGEEAYWGRGLSYSALSHAPLFAGRDVAVVGSGVEAQVAALELARIAGQVHLIARHQNELAGPYSQLITTTDRISVYLGWEVERITGDDYATGITLLGRDGASRTLPVEGIFVELGLLPESDFVRGLVELDERGRILVDQRTRTSQPGVFAAGDVANVYAEQVPVAIGEGVKAARACWEWIATQY